MSHEYGHENNKKAQEKRDRDRLFTARDSIAAIKLEWDRYYNGGDTAAKEAHQQLIELVRHLRHEYDYLKGCYDIDSSTGDVVLLILIEQELGMYEQSLDMV